MAGNNGRKWGSGKGARKKGKEGGEGKSPRVGAQQGRASEAGEGKGGVRARGRKGGQVSDLPGVHVRIDRHQGSVSRLILTYQLGGGEGATGVRGVGEGLDGMR